jgi:hypothetical protein
MRPSLSASISRGVWVLAGVCLIWQGGSSAQAGNLYVYTDSQGQAVMTDNLQQVPIEYRGRVRVMTDRESGLSGAAAGGTGSTVNKMPAFHNVMDKILTSLAQKVSSHPIKGLTPHQTAVVIVAGVCWSVLLLWMFLSSNPAVRLLSKYLMVLVCVTAVYQMYFARTTAGDMVTGSPPQSSEQAPDNVMGKMKTKVEQSFRLQGERTAGQLDQVEPSNP